MDLEQFPQYIDKTIGDIQELIEYSETIPYVPDVAKMNRRLVRSRNSLQAILPLFPKIINSVSNEAAIEEGLPLVKPLAQRNERNLALFKIRAAAEARSAAEAVQQEQRPEKAAYRALVAAEQQKRRQDENAIEEVFAPRLAISPSNREGIEAYGLSRRLATAQAAAETARRLEETASARRPERAAYQAALEGRPGSPPKLYQPGNAVRGEHTVNPEALREISMRQQLAQMTADLGGRSALNNLRRRTGKGGRVITKRRHRRKRPTKRR